MMLAHEVNESPVMGLLQEVCHCVNHDELEARRVFLGQLDVEPEVPGVWVARSPSGLHLSHSPVAYR